jgi:hypothetical protein
LLLCNANLYKNNITPNVVAEWLALLLHTSEVPGSNLSKETSYPDYSTQQYVEMLDSESKCMKVRIRI